ncbi:MAG TPA: polyprenol monophosphomannose synthase [Methanosarcinales archaeon]|nr:polyprenol monophosphomannose synthase [Methanosarcinales archaeon]
MMISIIIPTYNEKENLPRLVNKIYKVLNCHLSYEIIIVDDNSPDGTGVIADVLSKKYNEINVIHRNGFPDLSRAVVEGIKHSKGNIIGVMDADLSHPPEVIPKLIKPILDNKSEFVIGSRYLTGKIKKWTFSRKIISRGAIILARPLTSVSDPMSGFFFFKKNVINDTELSPIGYKIILEILVKGNYKKVKEIEYIFKDREFGNSKLNYKNYLKYLIHLILLYTYKIKKHLGVIVSDFNL